MCTHTLFSHAWSQKSLYIRSCDLHKHKQYRQPAVSQVLSSQVSNEFGTSNDTASSDTAIELTFTYSDHVSFFITCT